MALVCNQALLILTDQAVLLPNPATLEGIRRFSIEYLLVLATEFSSPLHPCVLAVSVSVSSLSFP